MTLRVPPRLATALMRELLPMDCALAGDLQEEYRAGRSARWYWWQVLGAVVIGVARDMNRHRLVPVRATLVGWAVLELCSQASRRVGDQLDAILLPHLAASSWLVEHGVWNLYRSLLVCAVAVAASWVVASLDRQHRAAAVTAFTMAYVARMAYLEWGWYSHPHLQGAPIHLRMPEQALYFLGVLVGGFLLSRRPESLRSHASAQGGAAPWRSSRSSR